MKILIMDDEVLIARAFEKIFKKKSHEVFLAFDGKNGLELWNSMNPDIVILDFIMPGLNADQILSSKPKQSEAKICLISAYIGSKELQDQMIKQVDLFFSKPFENIFEISEKIIKILEPDLLKDKN